MNILLLMTIILFIVLLIVFLKIFFKKIDKLNNYYVKEISDEEYLQMNNYNI